MNIRKKFSYLLVCSALGFLAYVVHQARTYTDTGEKPTLANLVARPGNPNPEWLPNETVTGNILSANFAQSTRDWAVANAYLDRMNSLATMDEQTARRMMLLSISAGQFDRAQDYARRVVTPLAAGKQPQAADAPVADNGPDAMGNGRDLAALILMARKVQAGDFANAEKDLLSLRSPALNAFVQPVILGWLKVAQNKKTDASVEGLSLVQVLHKGLAAEWGRQKAAADTIFDTLAKAPLLPAGAMTVAAYDIRNNRIEQARAVLTESLRQNPMDEDAKKVLEALNQGRAPVIGVEQSFHMQGATAGVGMAFRDLAQMMLSEGAADSALVFAQMGRLIRTDVPGLSILVDNIFADQGRNDDAAEAFLSVLPADSDYLDAQIRLAELRASEKKYAEATSVLETLMSSNPSARVAYALGEIYRNNDDNKKAVGAFDQAIALGNGQIDDELWSVYFMRGMALDELGEWDKAEADLKKALEYRPQNPHVLNYLAYSWADKGLNLQKAREMLVTALNLQPGDPFITDSLGWVYYREGNYKEATILLERAVSLKPYDSVLNDHLGDVYSKTGRTLEARYQWQRALEYAANEKDEKLQKSIGEKLGKVAE